MYEIVNKRRCNFLHCRIRVVTLCNLCVMFCPFLWYLALVDVMFVSPVRTRTTTTSESVGRNFHVYGLH